MNNLKALVEGLIFLAGEDGITDSQLEAVLESTHLEILSQIEEIKEEYNTRNHGIELVEFAGRYKFLTKEFVYPYGEKLFKEEKPMTLSQAAMETLAIVAYKQPVTRLEIEEIRGVSCEVMLKKLVAMDLIEAADRLDTVGKPLLYRVTDTFLDTFQLETLEELPALPDREISDNLFEEE